MSENACPEELRERFRSGRSVRGWQLDFEAVPTGLGSSWDYVARARELLQGRSAALDIATGGGECFEEICQGWPGHRVATEAWRPNVPIAHRRLARFGGSLVQASRDALPFSGAAFGLIVVRHAPFAADELARLLAPGGGFLTEQVHADSWSELRRFFPRMTHFGDQFEEQQEELRRVGLEVVDAQIHRFPVALRGLGDLVYALAAMPWKVPGFDLDADRDALRAAERELMSPSGLILTQKRFLIEAERPVT